MSEDINILQSLRVLLERVQYLEDLDTARELRVIELERQLKSMESAEAALEEQKIFAASADRLVRRQTFKEKLCGFYLEHESMSATVENVIELAETISEVVNGLYPSFYSQTAVTTLSAISILKKGIDIYCA